MGDKMVTENKAKQELEQAVVVAEAVSNYREFGMKKTGGWS